ncbi:MAG: hypothetical protein AAF228_05985 [Pseudomonadota bacterium]
MNTFKDIVISDLERGKRLIQQVGDEIDPQIRIATPEGDFWIAMTLSGDLEQRAYEFRLLTEFMILKQALGFVMVSELQEPDAIISAGITHHEHHCALSMIQRDPLSFEPTMWLAQEQIDPQVIALLPEAGSAPDPALSKDVKAYFGKTGKFPAVPINQDQTFAQKYEIN